MTTKPSPSGTEPDDVWDDVLVLEDFLPYRLSVLANTVSRALARQYQQRFGLGIPQWRVMAVLGRFPDLSATEVAGKTAMDKVTVSRAVNGLLADGRLERRTDAGDRRRSVLRLSPLGREVYDRIVPLARDYESRLMEALEGDEWVALDRAIERLTGLGRKLDTETNPTSPREHAPLPSPPPQGGREADSAVRNSSLPPCGGGAGRRGAAVHVPPKPTD